MCTCALVVLFFLFFRFTIFIIKLRRNNNNKNSHQLGTSGHNRTGLKPQTLDPGAEHGAAGAQGLGRGAESLREIRAVAGLWGGVGGSTRSLAFKVGIFTAFPGVRPRARGQGHAGGTAQRGPWTSPLGVGRLHASSKQWLPPPRPIPICRRSSQSEPQHLRLRPPEFASPECCHQFLRGVLSKHLRSTH